VSDVSNRLRTDFQIAGRCSLHGRNSSLGFSNSMQQEAFRSTNRGRSIGAQSREGRDRCPLRFKGVGFLVSNCDPLVLVVLSRMTFGISNYEHLIDAGLSSNVFPSFAGPQRLMPCATLFINNGGWSNRKAGFERIEICSSDPTRAQMAESRTNASERFTKIVLLVSRTVKRLVTRRMD
jgi:hypothetical protein